MDIITKLTKYLVSYFFPKSNTSNGLHKWQTRENLTVLIQSFIEVTFEVIFLKAFMKSVFNSPI